MHHQQVNCVCGVYYISQSGSETLTDEGNGTYTTDLDWNSDSIDFIDYNDTNSWLHG